MYPVKDGQLNIVEIELTGSRAKDFRKANQLAGFPEAGSGAPEGYTWHHVDDYNSATNRATMQLVDSDAHNATKPHKGSAGQYDDINGPTYNPPKKNK